MGLFSRRKPASAPVGPGVDRAASIVPLIAGPAWVEATRATLRNAEVPPSSWALVAPFAAGLSVTYAVDRPHGYDYIQPGQLDDLGATVSSLHDMAMDTLSARAAAAMTVRGGGGRYVLAMPGDDDLTASLLLVPHLWASRIEVAGGVVAAAATRVGLHLCGSDDAASVSGLADLAHQLYDRADGKPVTRDLLTWQDGQLQTHRPG